MVKNSQFSQVSRMFIVAASIAIVVLAMQISAYVLNMVLMTIFITILASPLLGWLQRKGLPGGVAVVATILVVLGFSLIIVGVIGLSLSQFPEKLPEYEVRLEEIKTNFNAALAGWGITMGDLTAASAFNPSSLLHFIAGILARPGGQLQ